MFNADKLLTSKWSLMITRISGHYLLALLCFLIPEVGEGRILGGLLLAFVIGPAAFILSYRFGDGTYQLQDVLCDLSACVVFGFLLPEHWYIIFMIGIVVTVGPGVTVQRNSLRIYAIALAALLVGMSASGFYYEIDQWYLAIIAIAALGPTVIFYAYWQMRIADQLRDSARAHESLQLISGGVAHDFNNILTGISGNAELALNDLKETDPAYESVLQVLEATNRASRLTRQLLTFSGRTIAEKESIDLLQELEVTAGLARSLAPDHVSIRVECSDELPHIEADPALLQQVFLNLMVNAIEASDKQSVVMIRLKSLGDQVEVEVSDQGRGIPVGALSRVFDPFYTSKSRGHGLGLATAKRIVEQHDGTIEASSAEGEGSIFTIRLPVGDSARSPRAVESADADRATSTRVLVIDDDAAVRKLLLNTLKGAGFEVVLAADGESGIECFHEHSGEFRCVLLDLKMPGISGWECLQEIRKSSESLPVVIISGYDPSDENRTVENDPSAVFLSKPFRLIDLERSMNKLLENPIKLLQQRSA